MIYLANWFHSFEGIIHLLFAIIGLITGSFLLIAKKGSKIHWIIGRVFAISLIIVNLSALFIYDFNDGKIGPFHFLIPVSLFFLLYGWIPMLRRKKKSNFINKHIIGMIGASLGLWAAGATEYYFREIVTVNTPKTTQLVHSFLVSLPFAILITILISIYLKKQKKNERKLY